MPTTGPGPGHRAQRSVEAYLGALRGPSWPPPWARCDPETRPAPTSSPSGSRDAGLPPSSASGSGWPSEGGVEQDAGSHQRLQLPTSPFTFLIRRHLSNLVSGRAAELPGPLPWSERRGRNLSRNEIQKEKSRNGSGPGRWEPERPCHPAGGVPPVGSAQGERSLRKQGHPQGPGILGHTLGRPGKLLAAVTSL